MTYSVPSPALSPVRCGSTETVELPYREAVYSVKWTERRGPVLTIIRGPQAITTVVCDTDGTCNPIDEDEN